MRHPARLLLSQRRDSPAQGSRRIAAGWGGGGLLVVAFSLALALASRRFGYAYDVAEMPLLSLVAGLIAAGLVFCLALPPLVRASLAAGAHQTRLIVLMMLAAGLAARLLLFASEPMLEDDYQRYLWDGAVTASATNPYAAAPRDARTLGTDTALGRLAVEAGPVVQRINHPELRSIYPPLAQGAFALAYLARPWSLAAWRAVLLLCDLATLTLILALLHETGRSPLWSALYWWNPLVLKELFNSAHMDGLTAPFVLLALLLAARGRNVAAGASVALAVGAKIWPALLLPLVVRPLAPTPRKLTAALLIFAAIVGLFVVPVMLAGFDASSGFTAYLTHWQTSSALFPVLKAGIALPLGFFGAGEVTAGLAARLVVAAVLGVLAAIVCWKPVAGADDLMGRASLLVAAAVLLSPAQFPWYALWFAPFLAFRPWAGFLLLTATAPLYYLSFYLIAAGEPQVFPLYVVWTIWVPVWIALAVEALRSRES